MTLCIGTKGEFARVRDFLHRVAFDEHAVNAAFKIPSISRLRDANPADIDRSAVAPALLTVIDLLISGDAVAADRLRCGCDDATLAAFTALDLIRQVPHREGAVVCPIWLYPVDGLLIASDRQTGLESGASLSTNEVVFPAHDTSTLRLLQLLPAERGGDALDLCSGSGICALHLARGGMRAVTADITGRSAHFATFNAHLNGLELESLRGDLYAPVAERKFDLICAHPPWVPSLGDAMVFRDGGETGEAIVARVIAGLPDHLRPGGTAILVSLGRDGRDASFQQRVRNWLGDAGRDCDVIVGIDNILSVDQMIDSMRRLHLNDDVERAERLADRFRELGTEKFVHGAVFIRRTGTPVTELPLRLRMEADTTASDFERIFTWRRFRRSAGFSDWLAAARPRPCESLVLTIRHVVRDGAMIADSAMLTAKRALSAVVQPDVWAAKMVAQLDSRQTLAQVFEAARRAGQMPDDFTLSAFVDFIGQMIERGLLDVDTPVADGFGHRGWHSGSLGS